MVSFVGGFVKRFPRPRRASELSKSLQQQLNMYALAAGAAGVGLLALVQPADAKVIYTKVHRVIGPNHIYSVDLNHDGINDFTVSNEYGCPDTCVAYLFAIPSATNGVEGEKDGLGVPLAYALRSGAVVGPKQPFLSGFVYMASRDIFGYWKNVTNRYLGVKFRIRGKIHYGWARLTVTVNSSITATLTGYAYETIPNKPIIAGRTNGPDDASTEESSATPMPTREPARLGLLALGSPGLSIWRREEPVGAGRQSAGT